VAIRKSGRCLAPDLVGKEQLRRSRSFETVLPRCIIRRLSDAEVDACRNTFLHREAHRHRRA
jgi:hypothetical protein